MASNQLPLPIAPIDAWRDIIHPAAHHLLPAKWNTDEARVLMLAIALQESGLAHRWQVVDLAKPLSKGPARGLWQFERAGGVRGVLRHPASRVLAMEACRVRGIEPYELAVWLALEHDDILAAVFARLLLLTDPKRLPAIGDEAGAWDVYLRCWRPGKAKPKAWPANYATAICTLKAATA